MKEPKTLMEAIKYFADPDVAFEAAKEFRFPAGVHCPTCGRTDVRFIATPAEVEVQLVPAGGTPL